MFNLVFIVFLVSLHTDKIAALKVLNQSLEKVNACDSHVASRGKP